MTAPTWEFRVEQLRGRPVAIWFTSGNDVHRMTLEVVRAQGRSGRDFRVPHRVVIEALRALRIGRAGERAIDREDAA